MIWTESLAPNKTQNGMPKPGNEDNDTWTTVWEDSDLDIFNVKRKNI